MTCRTLPRRPAGFSLLLLAVVLVPAVAPAGGDQDAFLAGYVTAVVEREFDVLPVAVVSRAGSVRIELPDQPSIDHDRVRTVVSAIRAVESVEVVVAQPTVEEDVPVDPDAPAAEVATAEEKGTELLPRGHLLEPLVADPRWPRFAADYQYYIDDSELGNAGAVSLGGEFPLLRWHDVGGGRLQLGLQGGIFALFDLDADSTDLINADYRIGLPLTYERKRISAMLRLFHQSSHLGDEFVLRDRVERINLSYEAVDALFAYRPHDVVRFYAAVGYLFHQEPSDLDPWWVQHGIELTSPKAMLGNVVRPFMATDLQYHEETDWDVDVSVATGVQLESPRLETQKIRLLLHYYKGRNPNGQFFERNIEYTGIGIHGDF